jgi:hypothetical protein
MEDVGVETLKEKTLRVIASRSVGSKNDRIYPLVGSWIIEKFPSGIAFDWLHIKKSSLTELGREGLKACV